MSSANPQSSTRPGPGGAPVPGRRRRGGARSFGLIALISFAVLLLAVAVLALSVTGRPLAAPDWLRARIEARADEVLPRVRLRFDRVEIQVDRFQPPRLRLSGVDIRTPDGARLARLEDVRSSFALRPLLSGELAPTDVQITGAVVTLRRLADGRFNVALGDNAQPLGQAASFIGLIEGLDRVFADPRLAALDTIQGNALTIRYEDARADRAWTVDGGRMLLEQTDAALSLSANLALLSGGADAATIEALYTSPKGSAEAEIGLSVGDLPAADLAAQSPVVAWLGALRAPISGALRGSVDAQGALGPLSATLQIGAGALRPNEQSSQRSAVASPSRRPASSPSRSTI